MVREVMTNCEACTGSDLPVEEAAAAAAAAALPAAVAAAAAAELARSCLPGCPAQTNKVDVAAAI